MSVGLIQNNAINYPEFGMPVGNPYGQSWQQTAVKVALLAAVTFAGFMVGGLLGAGIAFTACILLKVAYEIHRNVNQHRYRLEHAPIEVLNDAPKLGEYECVAVIEDPKVTRIVHEALEEDARNSIPMERQGFSSRLKRKVGGAVASTLAPFIG